MASFTSCTSKLSFETFKESIIMLNWSKCPICQTELEYQQPDSSTISGYYYCPNNNNPDHKLVKE
jgi:hypothetical protein